MRLTVLCVTYCESDTTRQLNLIGTMALINSLCDLAQQVGSMTFELLLTELPNEPDSTSGPGAKVGCQSLSFKPTGQSPPSKVNVYSYRDILSRVW